MALPTQTLALVLLLALPLWQVACSTEGGDTRSQDVVDDTSVEVQLPDFSVQLNASTLSGNAPLDVDFSASLIGLSPDEVSLEWFIDDVPSGSELTLSAPFYRAGAAQVEVRATYVDRASGQSKTVSDLVIVRILACGELTWGTVTLEAPTEIGPGEALTFKRAELFNEGDIIQGDFDVVVALSKDERWDPATDYEIHRETIAGMDGGLIGAPPSLDFSGRAFDVGTDAPNDVYFVLLVADPDDAVNECQKLNNHEASTNALTIDDQAGLKPDLILSNLSLPVDFIARGGETIQYTFSITNQGGGEARRFRHAFWLSTDTILDKEQDVLIASATDEGAKVNLMGPGQVLNFFKGYTIPDDLADGTYYLIGVVDALDELTEEDEDNNQAISAGFITMEYQAPSCFDLAFADIEVAPLSTYWDGSIQLTATIHNSGSEATPDDWTLRAFLSLQPSLNPSTATPAGEWLMDRVPAGQTRAFDFVLPISDALPVLPHYVGALVDPDGELAECDESNNAAQFDQQITINPIASVDLVMGAVAYHPSAVAAGETIKLEYSVANTGTSGATAFKLGFVLSPDPVISLQGLASGADILIGTAIQSSVPATGSVQRVDDLVIPVALDHSVTDYYIGVIADVDGTIGKDTDPSNNVGVASTILVVDGAEGGCYEDAREDNDAINKAATLAPGLYEELGSCGDEDWYAVEVAQHHSLVVRVVARELLAMAPVGHALKVELVSSDGRVAASSIAAPDALVQTYVVPETGLWHIRVVGEAANNRAQYDLEVVVTPPVDGVDLLAFDVDASPVSIYPGGAMSVGWRGVNGGLAAAGEHIVRIWLSRDTTLSVLDDTAVGQLSITGAPPISVSREVMAVVLPAILGGGDWYVILEVDADDDVVETVESNNVVVAGVVSLDASLACLDDGLEPNDSLVYATPLTLINGAASVTDNVVCPQLPDWFSIALEAGQAVTITADYDYNSALGQLEVALWDGVSNKPLLTQFSPIQPSVTLPHVGTAGTYYVRVGAKAINTANGPKTYQLSIISAEAAPQDVCWPDVYENNNDFSVAPPLGCGLLEATLCNADTDYYILPGQANQPISVLIHSAGAQVRGRLFSDLDGTTVASRSGNGALNYTPVVDGLLFLRIDPRSGPLSMSVYDYTLDIEGVPGVDLTVTAPDVVVDHVYQGDDTFVSFAVINGCDEAAGAFDATVWLSDDRVRGADDIELLTTAVAGGLAPGESLDLADKVTVPLSTAPGEYYLLVEADAAGDVLESNENNNVMAAPLSVGRLCLPDAYEPNDYLGQPAAAPALDEAGLDGLALCPADQDWFAVQAPAGTTLHLTARFSHAEGDLDLALYDSNYSTSIPVASSKSGDDDEEILYDVALAGTYFVRVTGFNGAAAAYALEMAFIDE